MSQQHSPTPWANDDGYIDDRDGSPIAVALVRQHGVAAMQSNACRIVACVNACEGISNEQLEALPVSELVLQRDELLAALKGILSVVRIRINDPRACQLKAARAAIRKVEGAKS